MSSMFPFEMTTSWNGQHRLPQSIQIAFSSHLNGLHFHILDCVYHGDPPPTASQLTTLWETEVVELFLRGSDDHYLEIEISPHGHLLNLAFSSPRILLCPGKVDDADAITLLGFELKKNTWSAEIHIPWHSLPPHCTHFNVFAIHGPRENRQYAALFPATSGESLPDFHRLQYFQPLPDTLCIEDTSTEAEDPPMMTV